MEIVVLSTTVATTYLPCNQQFGNTVEEHRSLNLLAGRNIEDNITHGYLSKQQWLRVVSWLDNVHSPYFLNERESNDSRENDKSNETESPTERKFLKHTNKGEARSYIPRRSDVRDPQGKENHSGEKKNHIGWHKNVTYYRGSSFRELKRNQICVAGLNRNLKSEDVAKMFESFGRIAFIDHQICVGLDGRTCTYVVFANNHSVQKAVKDMNGIKIRECIIKVTVVQ